MTQRLTPESVPLFATLDHAKVWINQALTLAVHDPKDAWHWGTLTYLTDGPVAKTVIWRGWSPKTASLRFFTDTRSGKWAALREDPRTALLLYCFQRGVQLSVQARATLQTGTAPRGRSTRTSPTNSEPIISRAPPQVPIWREVKSGPGRRRSTRTLQRGTSGS